MKKENSKIGLLRRALWTMLFMLFATVGFAQETVVKGNVKDATGEPVVGATVQVEGVIGGVITDVNGDFSIKCSPKAILNISYVGFESKKIAVSNRQHVEVVMGENATDLNEVVVTALGIKREAKALGYSVSEVKTDEIKQANTISPVAALQGKVAGLEINQSDGGMFGSTKILLRGASTLSQKNNQPIFVVDGVILDNPSSNTGDADWDSNINDYGNQLKNLNPDDFASVSVLKGAAATALYGSRGLNGAVVITTKKGGRSRGLGITFSQTFGIDNVYKSPDLQNEYLEGAFAGYNLYGDTYTETGSRWDPLSYSRNSEGKYSMIEQHGGYASEWAWGPHISWAAGKEFEQYDGT
nr:TonB-dependent receptor plug domain-containing protein [Prevotella sp.]